MMGRTDGLTDRRTPDSFIDPAMRAVSVMETFSFVRSTDES